MKRSTAIMIIAISLSATGCGNNVYTLNLGPGCEVVREGTGQGQGTVPDTVAAVFGGISEIRCAPQ